MIFRSLDFHNVDDMVPFEDGYLMSRLPEEVLRRVDPGIRDRSAFFSCGVEIRFKLTGPSVDLWLRTVPEAEGQLACLFYGSIQGGWQTSTYMIGREATRVRLEAPGNLATLKEITSAAGLPFSPEVFRLVLPYGRCVFLGAEGGTEPPGPADLPAECYLAYGSSITHGSLSLVMPCSYPFRIARMLKCDHLNKGFAGTARMEQAMAEYIVSRKDWSFASAEMGVNMLSGAFTPAEFERRVDTFTAILASDPRPVFATGIFGFPGSSSRADLFRSIVEKYAGSRLIYTDALSLLNDDALISQDGIHPSLEGVEQIASRWAGQMRTVLRRKGSVIS